MTQEGVVVIPYADSIAPLQAVLPDSLRGEELTPIVLENPVVLEEVPKARTPDVSWVYVVFILLFCLVGLRVKHGKRSIGALFAGLTETRLRGNVFDDTVRETSFTVLLNLLWVASAGVLLWQLVATGSEMMEGPDLRRGESLGIAICMGASLLYLGAMMLGYWVVGSVFTDTRRTHAWLKGAASSTGLETLILFPVALLVMCQPQWTRELLIIGAVAFILGKTAFILKGFRIFFTRFSSWLLFLYYLCSLEIIPLILIYALTLETCVRVV